MNSLQPGALGLALLLLSSVSASVSAQPTNQASPTLSGTVVDQGGSPVAGATVELYGLAWRLAGRSGWAFDEVSLESRVVTDATGAFALPVRRDNDPARLLARQAGFAPAWVDGSRMRLEPHRLTLGAPGILEGTVVDENDQPVGEAEVSVALAVMETLLPGGGRRQGYLAGAPARECFHGRTGADGRFRLEGFPTNATALLAVRVPGRALRPPAAALGFNTLPFAAGDPAIRLVVEPAGVIEGRLTGIESLADLPEVRLTLQPTDPGWLGTLAARAGSTLAERDGTFRIAEVPAGSYLVQARFGTNLPPERVAAGVPVTVASGQTAGGLEIPLIEGGLFEVVVVSAEDRQPLAGIHVTAQQQQEPASATTDASGRARLRLPPGDYQVLAQGPGRTMRHTRGSVAAGEVRQLEIELAGPQKLRGVVRRPDGEPASGLPVRVVGGFFPEESVVLTDAAGRFEVEWSPPRPDEGPERTCCLLIRDPDRGLAVAQEIEEGAGPLELRLKPGMTIVGRAECRGQPIAGVAAALVFWTGSTGMHLDKLARPTDVPGQFQIAALPVGRRYGVQVSAPGYGQRFINTVSADAAERVDLETIELSPANLPLAGQVVDADDQPVAGAHVNLHGEGQPNASVRTDRQGRFSFTQVCEGLAQLFASGANAHGSVQAEGGDTNVVLRLGETYGGMASAGERRTVQGTVLDPEGQPAGGVTVVVFPVTQARRKTDPDGTFNLTFTLEPWHVQSGGDPCLVVRDGARQLAATEDLPEDATNLTVRLKPALTFSGRVENLDGAPLAGAQVGMWFLAGNSYNEFDEQPATTDAQGAFALQAIPPGRRFLVFATAKGHGREQQSVDSDETDAGTIELDPFSLRLADQVIAGRVVDERERPVANAHVSLSGTGQPQEAMTTDRQGRFRFQVCDAPVRLFVSGQEGFANPTVEPGDTNVVVVLGRSEESESGAPRRASLQGQPLPDLGGLGVAPDALPTGQPRLVCLFDAEQRPSRRAVAELAARHAAMAGQKLVVIAIQAAEMNETTFEEWKAGQTLPFPVGRWTGKTTATKWVADVATLPWLILTDAAGRVVAEGFPLDELESKLGEWTR